MSERPEFQVGRDCVCWCGHCKANQDHAVVAMVGDKAHQVACHVCNTWHRYMAPKDLLPAAAGPPRSKAPAPPSKVRRARRGERKASASNAEERWQKAMGEAKGEPRAYDYRDRFVPGDLISHPSFGVGVITELEGSTRALGLFRSGLEAVLMNGGRRR